MENPDIGFKIKPNRIKYVLYTPIRYVSLYLFFTIFLYAFGPINWQTKNPIILYTYLIFSIVVLYYGYKSSQNSKVIGKQNISSISPRMKYFKLLIPINIIFTLIITTRHIGLTSFSISSIIEKIILGLSDPGQQYYEKFDGIMFGGKILTHLSVLLSPILWPIIPLSVYHYKKFNFKYKFLIFISIIIEISRWIATGTNKGIIDLILVISTVIILKNLQKKHSILLNNNDTINNNKKLKNNKSIKLIVIILFSIGISFFFYAIDSRLNGMFDGGVLNNAYNNNSIILMLFPDFFKPLIVYATSYLTQGYFALSLAINESFSPLFGIGNSMFLIENFSSIFNINLYDYTYQVKLAKYGWDPLANWHSLYVWLANDFHFIGIFPIFYILGHFFGSIYRAALLYGDSIAITLLCLLILIFFYLPMNNQVLSYPTTFFTFWSLTIYWYCYRLKSIKEKNCDYI